MSTSILPYIQTQMNSYTYPILIAFGDLGNIFIIALFYRQRQNACSIYIIVSGITNIFYLTISGSFKMFTSSYSDGGLRALILCKLSSYLPAFFGQVTKTLFIFACIDRYMITSKNVRLRAFSTPNRAKYISYAIYIISAIITIYILVGLKINNGQCIEASWFDTINTVHALLLVGFLPFLVICIFNYLIWRNMKQLHNRIQPTEQDVSNNNNNSRSLKRRDRDLLILIRAEAIIYIITTGPFTVVNIESMITQFLLPVKTLPLLQAEIFALNVAYLLMFVFSAVPFYTYIVASTSFRQEFKHLVLNSYSKIRRLLLAQDA